MKFMKNTIFIVWIVVIAVLSIIPHANGGLSFKLTESGMVLHFGAYFVGTALFFWAFIKDPQITPVPSPGATGQAQITRIRKDTLFFILIPSFTIFLYSVVLEFVQLYLPYRTFNPMDIAANGVGVVFFVGCWVVFWRRNRKGELGMSKEEIGPQITQITRIK